jgi:hypothetical protein
MSQSAGQRNHARRLRVRESNAAGGGSHSGLWQARGGTAETMAASWRCSGQWTVDVDSVYGAEQERLVAAACLSRGRAGVGVVTVLQRLNYGPGGWLSTIGRRAFPHKQRSSQRILGGWPAAAQMTLSQAASDGRKDQAWGGDATSTQQ